MKIVIASGKGGTGKTTVATNLAWVAALAGGEAAYADCDVEEPNGHLFLKPALSGKQAIHKRIPVVDHERCAGCGECAKFCRFHALVCLNGKALVSSDLCHACGGCQWVCPQQAITEALREIGGVGWGRAGKLQFVHGCLQVGQAQSPPVIHAVKAAVAPAELTILDAPPGTSCPVVATARGADFLLLVAEPTPFGLYDLGLALEMARTLRLDCGVVINRARAGRLEARQFCQRARLPVLAEIPDDLAVAKAYSEGVLAVEAVPGLRQVFAQLLLRLASTVKGGALPEKVRRNLEKFAQAAEAPAGTNVQTPKILPFHKVSPPCLN